MDLRQRWRLFQPETNRNSPGSAKAARMKVSLANLDSGTETCELCLKPMRYLGDHAERRLFRCEDCALVTTYEFGFASGVTARKVESRRSSI
jgi:hypothetical protein